MVDYSKRESLLFGCCEGRREGLMREYQHILGKMLVEDTDFWEEMAPTLDVNADFPGEHGLRRIMGTLVDMRAKFEGTITWDALEMEATRTMRNRWDVEEAQASIALMRDMELDEGRRRLARAQFGWWRRFVVLAKIGNACWELKEDGMLVSDARLDRIADEVRALAATLEPRGDAEGAVPRLPGVGAEWS